MEHKLQLSVFMLLIQVSLAMWQHVTVRKGQTVTLRCPVTNAHQTNIEWRNPEGYVMFFRHNKALKDKRYSINKLSESEFTVSITNVTFKDGGNYTCTQYGRHITEKKVEVTVLSHPMMRVTNHAGKFVIKCTAEANHPPPQIFWKLDQGPEILAHAQVLHEGKKYVSMDMLHVHSVEKRVTVECLVRHPALHSQHLMNFVKIGRDSTKSRHTPTTRSPSVQPQGSTEVPSTTTQWFRHGRTTVYLTTRDVNGASSGSSGDNSRTSVSSGSTRSSNETISNATSTTGWISDSETTEITSHNSTEGNRTGIFNDPDMRTGTEGSSSLLVFLVTCLIFGLLVVVIFFTIKLRKAHITWKKENEESDPSEESSKSKSSQEEKNSQGQRRRGLFNTAFTQYVAEKPTVITSVINTAAMAATDSVNREQASQPQILGQTSAQCNIKETEL